jgi:hypothetical protein
LVLRAYVKSYGASSDHSKALDLLAEYIPDKGVLNLLSQIMRRTTVAAVRARG